jgi:predicted AAA+ superfamily ATPase
MERNIINQLLHWKNKPNRMPLLLNGARQVGKTWTCLNFGKEHYRNTVYFDMEDSRDITEIFERDLNPERIIRELAAISGESIFERDTLIIFDEIQACGRALTSLKYFCEKAPDYHIIAAGSLLGVALNREKYSFPVGKTDMLSLFPLDFEEFLKACGNEKIGELIKEACENFTPLSLHEKAMELYRTYIAIGGMPQVVEEYIRNRDFDLVTAIQKNLNNAYIADMAKYATAQETTRIMAAWASIPAQLAKDNHKFQYRLIKSGARANNYELPLQWLSSAGIINRCVKVNEGKMPLSAYAENAAFKIYLADTGILCSKFGLDPQAVLSGIARGGQNFDGFKGALTENYVCQVLSAKGITPYYWESAGKAEVDFVFQDKQGNIIPLEVKSSAHVRSKSLGRFIELYKPPYAIRVSARNFGFERGIKSIPLYGVFAFFA